jgi:hypothetical protein
MLLAFTPSKPLIFLWLWSFAGNVAPAFCVTQEFQNAYLFQPFEFCTAVIFFKCPLKPAISVSPLLFIFFAPQYYN